MKVFFPILCLSSCFQNYEKKPALKYLNKKENNLQRGHMGPHSFFLIPSNRLILPEHSGSRVQTVRRTHTHMLPTSENIYAVKFRAEQYACYTSYNLLLTVVQLLCLCLQR